MLADCIESAARAMPDPTSAGWKILVHELTMRRLMDHQFDDCDLTSPTWTRLKNLWSKPW